LLEWEKAQGFWLVWEWFSAFRCHIWCHIKSRSCYSVSLFYCRFTSSRQRTPDMGYPEPTTITNDEFWSILDKLGLLLRDIPKELPDGGTTSTHYGTFINFHLDEELLDKTGDEVSTLGEQLERVFGWKARTSGDGTLPILERGKSIQALHGIFSTFYQKFPENNVLKKWVIDVCIGLEKVYEQYHKEVSATAIYIMTSLMRVRRFPTTQTLTAERNGRVPWALTWWHILRGGREPASCWENDPDSDGKGQGYGSE